MGTRALHAVLLAFAVSMPATAQTVTDTRLRVQTWTSGLSLPTTFAWIGPGEMLVMQKDDGKVIWVKDGVIQGTALDLIVQHDSERGGLGITVDPDFATNQHVYVYYSTTTATGDSGTSSKWADNRVERYDWNGSALVNAFGPIAAFPKDTSQQNGPNHDGGVIRFGPDSMLYGQTGDLNRGRFGPPKRVEQNTAATGSALVGAIFRIASDGSIPSDNPFVNETDSNFHAWYCYGFRNGFGMTWDAMTTTLWATENGPDKYDEVNRVPSGMNSGWLKIMGPDSRNATYAENGFRTFDASDLTYLGGAVYVDPELSFKSPIGITAIAFLESKRFPSDLRNSCVIGDNNTGSLYYCAMKASRTEFDLPSGLTDKVADNATESGSITWGSGWGTMTDAQIGSDGYLYVANLAGGTVLVLRPVTDNVEPAAIGLLPNLYTSGSVANVEIGDDLYYTVQEGGRGNASPPFAITGDFLLNASNPTSIVLEVEDHFSHSLYVQDLHVLNTVTAAWDKVDTVVLGKSDVLRSITLTSPTQYVDPNTLLVRTRVVVTEVPRPNGPGRGSPPLPVTLSLDLFRLDVTYP